MDICVPKDKPTPEWLPYIDTEHRNRARVTNKSDNHGGINDILEFLFANNIGKKSGKEGTSTQSDHAQIKYDPKGKGKIVGHICLIKALVQAEES